MTLLHVICGLAPPQIKNPGYAYATTSLIYEPVAILLDFMENQIHNLWIAVIVITFYSPSCLGQETAKGPYGLRVKLPPVCHTRRRFHTVPFSAERQAGKL